MINSNGEYEYDKKNNNILNGGVLNLLLFNESIKQY